MARLTALDWDAMAGLHADERHMAFMVSAAAEGLKQWGSGEGLLHWEALYFDAAQSPLNPRQHSGFYVYGEAPLLISALMAYLGSWSEWTEVLLHGRALSALADSITILLVFLLEAKWSASRWSPVLAAGLYASMPVALREAHFFTVDTSSTAFGVAAIYAASFWNDRPSAWRNALCAIAAGLLLGLSVACKPSGALFALAVSFVIIAKLRLSRDWRTGGVVAHALLCAVATLFAFRLANPYAFQGPHLWGLALEPRFLDDLAEQSRLANAGIGWVPNWYWLDRASFLQFIKDLVFWGFGPAISLAATFAVLTRWSTFTAYHVSGLCFVVAVLALYSTYPTPYLRYALPIAPIVAILAGQLAGQPISRSLAALGVLCLAGAAVQAQAVLGMLIAPHTRVEASAFLWRTLPLGSVILNETNWDETLPAVVRLPGDKEARWPFADGKYKLALLGLQEPDSAAKAVSMAKSLSEADVLVESSQRFSNVIPRLASRFPMSSSYYDLLENGGLCYQKIREFRRGLSFLGLFEVDDTGAQESWFIYDHPIVKIYRREACFSRQDVEQKLLQALGK
jgi:4-amino-4-deoxy-L-arabinose transferase-like glycosyltransferase